MRMINHSLSSRQVLSQDEIFRVAPSVFASAPHEAVSEKYRFIPTFEMLDTLKKEGWECVQAGEHKVRCISKKGFQKHMLRLRNPNLARIGDSEIDLLVYNSHDRTTGFKFMAGVYRFVCANGMVTGQNIFGHSVKHVGYRAEDAIEASYRLIDSVGKISESVEGMRSLILTPDQRVAFATSALTAKYGTPEAGQIFPITASDLLRPRRSEDAVTNSLWETLNVIQENSILGGQRGRAISPTTGRMKRTTTRGVSSITENSKLNAALWTLADDEMKKLVSVPSLPMAA